MAGNAAEVLALLAKGDTRGAEALMGKPITRCPPARATAYGTMELYDRMCDAIRFSHPDMNLVAIVIRKPHYDAVRAPILSEIQTGQTVAQMVARGIPLRYIRRAIQEGWLVLGTKTKTGELRLADR